MEILAFVMIISFAAGFLWGRYTTKVAFTLVFERFTHEMQRQYLACLKSKGIKVKTEFDIDLPIKGSNRDKTSIAS